MSERKMLLGCIGDLCCRYPLIWRNTGVDGHVTAMHRRCNPNTSRRGCIGRAGGLHLPMVWESGGGKFEVRRFEDEPT